MLGQGQLYVLEKRNRTYTNGSWEFNGPKFKERTWNARPLNKAAVHELAEINGGRIYPLIQEYAIVIAVSGDLLAANALAPYNSHKFPRLSFPKNSAGEIHIVNGHHRIEALIYKHKELIDQHQVITKTLGSSFKVPSENDTYDILEARTHLSSLEDQLEACGCWGAIFLNYGEFKLLFIRQLNNCKCR